MAIQSGQLQDGNTSPMSLALRSGMTNLCVSCVSSQCDFFTVIGGPIGVNHEDVSDHKILTALEMDQGYFEPGVELTFDA